MQKQLAIFLLLSCYHSLAQFQEVRGAVFNNTNGKLLGIPGVVISDQDTTVDSDTQGTWKVIQTCRI